MTKATLTVAAALATSALATSAFATTAQLETEVGVGQLDQDWLLTARVGFLWFDEATTLGCRDTRVERCVAPIRVALNLPLRFELHEAPPSDDDIVRSEDWDDVGDFFRLLRFAQYGERWQPLYVRTGELGGVVLGHGTIANGYLNTITTGDFAPGVEVAVNTVHGGLHMFLNDYTRPSVLGLRGNVRPFADVGRGGERSFWHRFAIGVSAVSDFAAPSVLVDGDVLGGSPVVEESSALTVAGLDVELSPVTTDVVEWLLYSDVNVSLGVGAHLGSTLRLSLGDDWSTSLRAEARLLGKKYVADYFGPLYHVDRYQFAGYGARPAAPKSRVAAAQTDTRWGGFAQLDVAWRELMTVSVAGADHEGAGDSSAMVRLAVTPPGPFAIGLYWANLNRRASDLFKLRGSLVASEARLAVWGPIYLHGRYDRLFRLDAEQQFTPTTEWNVGVGAAFNL